MVGGSGSFLGVISFEFILVLILPPLGYNTRIDDFLMLSFGVIFVVYIYNGVRIGYFKTLENLSGRGEDESKHDGGAPKSGSNKEAAGGVATTDNPMHAQQAGTSSSGATAAAAHHGADEAAREKSNDLRKVFTVKRASCCWAGSWEELNPHRKLDVIFGVAISIVYIIATLVILLRQGVVKELK